MTSSLQHQRSPLASADYQQALLNALPLSAAPHQGNFDTALAAHNWQTLQPERLEIFQINLGKLCNMTCRHCHVDAAPDRHEVMDRDIVNACLSAIDQTNVHTIDLTGGAPELNPHFRYLVDECTRRGKKVIDRCNLTVLLLPMMQDLPQWLAQHQVEIVCSLPHYRQRNTDAQRGDGTFEKSIAALKLLNAVGYGQGDPSRCLTLMSNPVGAFLSSSQASLEQEWKAGLFKHHGITFDRLITLNNMPISRYLEWLESSNNLQRYMELLVNAFNPDTIAGLMCRNTLSVSWDGQLFDCDFNQMLELDCQPNNGQLMHITDFQPEWLVQREIVTGRHCFGCTAGAGSSCGGAIKQS